MFIVQYSRSNTSRAGEFQACAHPGALAASEGPLSGRPKIAVQVCTASAGAAAVPLMLETIRPGVE